MYDKSQDKETNPENGWASHTQSLKPQYEAMLIQIFYLFIKTKKFNFWKWKTIWDERNNHNNNLMEPLQRLCGTHRFCKTQYEEAAQSNFG